MIKLKIRLFCERRKKGQWEYVWYNKDVFESKPFCCSKCYQLVEWPTKYCPNCGARMVDKDEIHN